MVCLFLMSGKPTESGWELPIPCEIKGLGKRVDMSTSHSEVMTRNVCVDVQ